MVVAPLLSIVLRFIHWFRPDRVVAEFQHRLARFTVPERFAGPIVELLGDRVEVVLGEDARIGAFGEVPARRPVGVLVGPMWGRPGESRESGHLADDGIPCISMLLYIVKRLGVLFWVGCRVYPLDGPLLEFGKVACAAFDLADAARGHAERLADLLLGDVPADA